jgi:hypothetical protein
MNNVETTFAAYALAWSASGTAHSISLNNIFDDAAYRAAKAAEAACNEARKAWHAALDAR